MGDQITTDLDPLKLKAKYRKTACAVAWNVQYMAQHYGLQNLGFLTLTFAEHVLDPKTAQHRFNSLRTNILSGRYSAYIRVFERQKSGRIHYHLIIVAKQDLRTGANFSEFKRGLYKSANQALRSEWAFWRKTASEYGFGRTELLPIRSTAEGIGRYVGKYVGKHFNSREEGDKGIRLVDYSKGGRMASVRHSAINKGTELWRSKMELFAQIMGYRLGFNRSLKFSELTEHLGKKWAYNHRQFILELPDMILDGTPLENEFKTLFISSILDKYIEDS